MNKLRYTMFVLTVFLVFAMSIMITVPALADDSTPPPTEAPTVETPPTEEVAPVVEEVASIPETTLQDSTAVDILASVPEGTDIIVVNADGEAVPLASAEATDIIESNDPIWCPTGVAPNPGVGGCTLTQASFNGGLIPLINNKTVNGTIWILGDYQGTPALEGGSIVLNNSNSLGTTANYGLTIKGGWTGTTAGAIDTGNPSEFNVPLSILFWNADVILNDILITGIASGQALDIETSKNISLTRVDVGPNQDGIGGGASGAYLDNLSGGAGTGNVTINLSNFRDNDGGSGLVVVSYGIITLSNVTSIGNAGDGASLSNQYASLPKNVVLNSGFFDFNDNGNKGLGIATKGSILLKDITASGNGDIGVYLRNDYIGTAGNISVVGTNILSGNGNDGLHIRSYGTITVSNVIANGNSGYGGYFFNEDALTPKSVTLSGWNEFKYNDGGGLYIYSTGNITASNVNASYSGWGWGAYLSNGSSIPAKVTLTGVNTFNHNGASGLQIISNGAVAVSNVTAEYNAYYGADLDNQAYNETVQNMTISGINNFNNNGYFGLIAYASGTLTVSNLTAKYNQQGGAHLNNFTGDPAIRMPLTLNGINTFIGNGSTGFSAVSRGAITLYNITAIDNAFAGFNEGVRIDNALGSTGKPVTLYGTSVIRGSSGSGLVIDSGGAITLNNLTSTDNGGYGAQLNNGAYGVTLAGANNFNGNGFSGLEIHSLGMIKINRLTASNNGREGAYLDNCILDWFDCSAASTSGILLSGGSEFYGNGETGLEIYSGGSIQITDLKANQNGLLGAAGQGYGVYLKNNYSGASGNVTLSGHGQFEGNFLAGLELYSNGMITLNNITASDNGANGVYVDNAWEIVWENDPVLGFIEVQYANNKSITLVGTNFFNGNTDYGLEIHSSGVITTSNLTANLNGPVSALADEKFHGGVYINNATDPTKFMNVTLLGINQFNGNWNTGLQITSYGIITLNNITANDNGELYDVTNNPTPEGQGVKIDNSGSSLAKAVTLNGVNSFNGNLNDGLNIQSKGAIVVNKVTANGNGLSGATLNNQFGVVNSVITLLGYGTFNDNGDTGLWVFSRGNITLNNITANGSTGGVATGGAYVENYSHTTTPVSVTLLGNNSFNNNLGTFGGLVVNSDGQITVNNITATNNLNGSGVSLDNAFFGNPLAPRDITLLGTNTFVNNNDYGLYLTAAGNVILTRIVADLNGSAGLRAASFTGAITFTCGSLTNNQGYGYDLTAGTGKLITLKGVFTYGNLLGNTSTAPTVSTRTCPLP